MLNVEICSFSYKQKNEVVKNSEGGGFIFDCRCLPNPGREQTFKAKSGLDQEVKDYLSARSEVKDFFKLIDAMVKQSVQAYIARNFTSLSVGFGCTGGQHRSVYLAEKLAQSLRAIDGVTVTISHANQANWIRGEK